MKRWILMLTACAALATTSCAANAQNMGAPATPAPRDTAHAGIRYIYLIRHAWYDGDDPRDERIGKGIDSLGRVQSKLVADRLAALPIKVDQLVTSTFTRARETANIIGTALRMPAVRDSDLCECTLPSNRPDYMRNHSQGELDSCMASVRHAFARYFVPAGGRDDKHDVLVTHGNVTRWLLCRAMGIDTVRWPEFDIGNCSITAFIVRPDGAIRLAAFSDTGHLPASAQTWTGRGAGWSPPSPRRPAAAGAARGARVTATSPRADTGILAPAPAAAYDTLRHVRPKDR